LPALGNFSSVLINLPVSGHFRKYHPLKKRGRGLFPPPSALVAHVSGRYINYLCMPCHHQKQKPVSHTHTNCYFCLYKTPKTPPPPSSGKYQIYIYTLNQIYIFIYILLIKLSIKRHSRATRPKCQLERHLDRANKTVKGFPSWHRTQANHSAPHCQKAAKVKLHKLCQ